MVADKPRLSNSSASGWKRILRGRYKIVEDAVIGQGGMATVYKGLDTLASPAKNVAVKLYNTDPGDSSGSNLFKRSVQVLQAINKDIVKEVAEGKESKEFKEEGTDPRRQSFDPDGLDFTAYYDAMNAMQLKSGKSQKDVQAMTSKDSAGVDLASSPDFLQFFDVSNCFVTLLDHSKAENGDPGLDTEDDSLWLVFELGEESLHDVLADCNERKSTLKQKQLRDLQWTLVSIVWGLHAAGYVHLDIKPKNIMKFKQNGREQWKLIDLDGAVTSGLHIGLEEVTFTPEYMPPELANAMIHKPDDPLVMSRLMDVWSVGMCAMEAIFLQPVLGPFYDQWQEETGGDLKFFEWLGKYESDPIMSGDMKEYIGSINEDMANLLERMLEKDPNKRFCIGQCLAHKWFEPVREEIARTLQMGNEKSSVSMKYSMTSNTAKYRSFGARTCAVM